MNPSLQSMVELGVAHWTGCNWQTAFGVRALNLEDVRSHQARLLSGATSGSESAAWLEAAEYLEQVEADAIAASEAANRAAAFHETGKVELAIAEAERAVELESRHRPSEVWRPLLEAIKACDCDFDLSDQTLVAPNSF